MSIIRTICCQIIFGLAISSLANAQESPPWKVLMTGRGPGADVAQAARMDAAGNLYVTGTFSSEARFGNKSLASSGNTDIFLAKYSSGVLQWIVQSGGTAEDAVSDMALDGQGNIYLTGWVAGTAAFHSTGGEPKILENNGVSNSIFIAKYDANGTLLWLQSGAAGAGMNRGHGIAVDPASGNCYVTGMAQTATTFTSSSGGINVVPGPGTWHMFLVKYDANGNFAWGQSNTASPNSIARKVALDKDQNAYVTGWFESAVAFSGGDDNPVTVRGFSSPVQYPPYLDDAFLVKYDSNGHLKWINHIGGYKAIGVDVAVSDRGFVSITGFIGNLNDGDPAHAQTIVTSQGGQNNNLGGGIFSAPYNNDAFIATYTLDGAVTDTRRIGGMHRENGSSLVYDEAGELYVSGAIDGALVINDQEIRANDASNLFVLKYSGGQVAWIKTAANAAAVSNPESGHPRLAISPGGQLLVAGAFSADTAFDDTSLSSAGLEDAFVAEIGVNEPSFFQHVRDWFGQIL